MLLQFCVTQWMLYGKLNHQKDEVWVSGRLKMSLFIWSMKKKRHIRPLPFRCQTWISQTPYEIVRTVAEGYRLAYAHQFNPRFATESSLIDPLPHQRVAVYEHMLPQPRLRYLLADDAGAGKTIMAGLYIREMLARRLIRVFLLFHPPGWSATGKARCASCSASISRLYPARMPVKGIDLQGQIAI